MVSEAAAHLEVQVDQVFLLFRCFLKDQEDLEFQEVLVERKKTCIRPRCTRARVTSSGAFLTDDPLVAFGSGRSCDGENGTLKSLTATQRS